MSDAASALVGRFQSLLRQVGCRAMPVVASAKVLVGRDLSELSAGIVGLPGRWRLETTESTVSGAAAARILPPGGTALPEFAFARREGFITVRMTAAGAAGSLVFGVFATAIAALDAIHNDVMSRMVYGDRSPAPMASPWSA